MARRTRTGGRGEGAGEDLTSLPALSSLSDLPEYEELHAHDMQVAAFDTECARLVRQEAIPAGELRLGCVVRLDRGYPAVRCADALVRAEFSSQLTKGGGSRVAVGDWVCARMPAGHDKGLIQAILPRTSDLARWRGGTRGERQTLAANVDVVLVCHALGAGRISSDRIARPAVIARDCGADVVIVLTKADRACGTEVRGVLRQTREVLGGGVPVIVTGIDDAHGQEGVTGTVLREADALRSLVGAGMVAVVLGESGAGKSTLLNALMGHDTLETGSVRARDDAGRHTTVARRMVRIPGGGVIIDAPGLRSLPLVGHERGLRLVFPEIAEAAAECRFRDCTHTHEPGCMVRDHLEAGRIAHARLDAYLSLARQMREGAVSLDPDVQP